MNLLFNPSKQGYNHMPSNTNISHAFTSIKIVQVEFI